ncbi:hypothetical protein HanRHA438_Chr14g0666671 [Helianthus annuus]|nr:hypothetical protein HanRHA438_Chr14g0666671 [Helianthus annuus]
MKKIQNLEKEVNGSKLIQKRKSLENSINQEAIFFLSAQLPLQVTNIKIHVFNMTNQSLKIRKLVD